MRTIVFSLRETVVGLYSRAGCFRILWDALTWICAFILVWRGLRGLVQHDCLFNRRTSQIPASIVHAVGNIKLPSQHHSIPEVYLTSHSCPEYDLHFVGRCCLPRDCLYRWNSSEISLGHSLPVFRSWSGQCKSLSHTPMFLGVRLRHPAAAEEHRVRTFHTARSGSPRTLGLRSCYPRDIL